MKKLILITALLGITMPAGAVTINTDPIFDFFKAKSNEMYYGPQVNFKGVKGFGLSLPIYTVHNGKKGASRAEYALFGVGYGRLEGGIDRLQADFFPDLIGLSNKLWKQAFADKVDVTKLPPVKFGPYIQAPDLNNLTAPWVIGDRTGLRAVYRFGKPE